MKTPVKVWIFKSDSSDKSYQTLLYADGSTSCDCFGWTKRSARTCKHTRSVDCGVADQLCASSTDYRDAKKPMAPSVAPVLANGGRKFDFNV